MADDQVVLYEAADGVATLTLNRPDRLNAWTGPMEQEYFDGLETASADPDVKVIVLTGAGRGFCAGADMEMLQGIGETGRVGSGGDGSGDGRREGSTPRRARTASKHPRSGKSHWCLTRVGRCGSPRTPRRLAGAAQLVNFDAEAGPVEDEAVQVQDVSPEEDVRLAWGPCRIREDRRQPTNGQHRPID